MISFFTTPKPFLGITGTQQVNSIQTWLEVHHEAEVLIFSADEIPSVLHHPRIKILREFDNLDGIPFIGDMFLKAQKIATNGICCFVNADILIPSRWIKALQTVSNYSGNREFLMIGQRINIDLTRSIEVSSVWEDELLKDDGLNAGMDNGFGSDYFAFKNGAFEQNDIPNLIVGRPGWDLWMLYHARKSGFISVDISADLLVYHQNHDYSHKTKNKKLRDLQDNYNYQFLPSGHEYTFVPVDTCSHTLRNGSISKSYARKNVKKYLKILSALSPENRILSLAHRVINKLLI